MRTPVRELVGFTVRLTREEHTRLADLAESEHRSLGAQARMAIVEHLKRGAEGKAA